MKLLSTETLEKYYWLGFILADGHISNDYRLTITLSIKDVDHLKLLSSKIGGNVRITKKSSGDLCTLAIMNKKILKPLTEKYNICNNKTINPPNIFEIEGDKLEALKIGFIDGDGCIDFQHKRKDFKIRIKVHSSWEKVLYFFFNNVNIDKNGYAYSSITNTVISKNLKVFAINNNLPILKRKWDIIDISKKFKYEIAKERVELVKQYLLKNIKKKDIAKKLGVANSTISQIIKRNKL